MLLLSEYLAGRWAVPKGYSPMVPCLLERNDKWVSMLGLELLVMFNNDWDEVVEEILIKVADGTKLE